MIAIQLFGITESKSLTSWQDQLVQVLEELQVEYDIQVVSDLEQFILYDLRGIPALVIGEEVLFQRQLPDVDELIAVLREKIDNRSSSQNIA